MEAASEPLVPSPSSPNNALVSPETLSHHSSQGVSPRTFRFPQHVTIDEINTPSSVRSSTHQLIQSYRSTPSSPPPPFHSGPMTPTTSGLSRESMTPATFSDTQQLIISQRASPPHIINSPLKSPTSQTQLAVLYQTHHHHHIQPILSPTRRPSRLPEQSRFSAQQQALAEHEIRP